MARRSGTCPHIPRQRSLLLPTPRQGRAFGGEAVGRPQEEGRQGRLTHLAWRRPHGGRQGQGRGRQGWGSHPYSGPGGHGDLAECTSAFRSLRTVPWGASTVRNFPVRTHRPRPRTPVGRDRPRSLGRPDHDRAPPRRDHHHRKPRLVLPHGLPPRGRRRGHPRLRGAHGGRHVPAVRRRPLPHRRTRPAPRPRPDHRNPGRPPHPRPHARHPDPAEALASRNLHIEGSAPLLTRFAELFRL